MPQEFDVAEALAEVGRLRVKQSAIDDEDIRLALQARIDSLETEINRRRRSEATAKVEEAPITPPTPAEMEEADRLVREARVEKMRGNASRATDLMKQAAAAAPTAPAVLEALGDDFAERRQLKEAIETYARAIRLDPRNVGLEKKHADLVFQTGTLGSLDDQMKANLSDSPWLASTDAVASAPAATLISAFLPGLGHIILGRTAVGFSILAAWILCGLFVFFHAGGITYLFGVRGGASQPDYVVFLPLVIMVILYIGTLNSLRPLNQTASRKPVDRPKPPVDLPFE